MGILEELENFVDTTGDDEPSGYSSSGEPIYQRERERETSENAQGFREGYDVFAESAWSGGADLTMLPFDMLNAGLGAAGLHGMQSDYPQSFRETLASRGRYRFPSEKTSGPGESALVGLGRAVGGGAPLAAAQLRMAMARKFAPELYKRLGPILKPFEDAPGAALKAEMGAAAGGETAFAELSRHTDDPWLLTFGSLVGGGVGATPGALGVSKQAVREVRMPPVTTKKIYVTELLEDGTSVERLVDPAELRMWGDKGPPGDPGSIGPQQVGNHQLQYTWKYQGTPGKHKGPLYTEAGGGVSHLSRKDGGGVPWAVEFDGEATAAALPPVAPGRTRLYRGAGSRYGHDEKFGHENYPDPPREGLHYSDDIDTAEMYRRAYGETGEMSYIDVPTEKLGELTGVNEFEFIIGEGDDLTIRRYSPSGGEADENITSGLSDFEGAMRGDPHPSIGLPGKDLTDYQIKEMTEAMGGQAEVDKWVGRANMERLETTDDWRRMFQVFREDVGDTNSFYAKQYEGIPVEQSLARGQQEMYDMLGWGPDEVFKRENANTNQLVQDVAAVEKFMQVRLLQVHKAMYALQSGAPGGYEELIKAGTDLTAATYMFEGRGSDMGRAFNLRRKANASKVKAQAYSDLIEKFASHGQTGREHLAELVAKMAAADKSQQAAIMRRAMENVDRGWGWRASEVWMSGLLSAPSTHKANMSSNGIFSGWFHFIEEPIAAGLGAMRVGARQAAEGTNIQEIRFKSDALTKRIRTARNAYDAERALDAPDGKRMGEMRGELKELNKQKLSIDKQRDRFDRVYLQEALAQQWGLVKGARMAWNASAQSWKNSEAWAPPGGSPTTPLDVRVPAAKTRLGKAINTPFRALEAEDSFFKQSAYYSRLMGLGMKDAIELGLPIKQRWSHASAFAMKPPEKAMLEAMERAKMLTFTTELGPKLKLAQHFVNSHPWAKLAVPFMKTPVNVTREGWARIPGAPLFWTPNSRFYHDLKRGGVHADRAMARQATGALLLASISDDLDAGLITGAAPRDPYDRMEFYQQGKKPFSRLTTTLDGRPMWKSYARDEPLATPVAVVATIDRWIKEGLIGNPSEFGMAVVQAMAENVINKSMLQGPQMVMEALADPERMLPRTRDKYAGSIIPSGINQLAVSMDPHMRDVSGMPMAVLGRIPGVRELTFQDLRDAQAGAEHMVDNKWAHMAISGAADWAIQNRHGPIIPIRYDWAGRKFPSGDPEMPTAIKMAAEYRSVVQKDPIIQIMYANYINPGEPQTGVNLNSVALARAAKAEGVENPEALVKFALTLRDPFTMALDSHDRQEINRVANTNAHKELMRWLPKADAMRKRITTEPIPIEELAEMMRETGAPDGHIDHLLKANIQSATMSEVVGRFVLRTYGRKRLAATQGIIRRWIRTGRLTQELGEQITRQEAKQSTREGDQ
jgi:hypothetical protein